METKIFQPNGAAYITKLITDAEKAGHRFAVVAGNWEMEAAVRLPSDFTLILDGCHLKMADGVYSNMFNNLRHDTQEGRTVAGTDHNISIIGKNGAIIDGGTYNGLSEKNHSKDGLPPIYKNNLLLFTNVDGFRVENIACHNQRWWALCFVYCRNGWLRNIDFKACDIGIDEQGNPYHGVKRSAYAQILVKNADGIDLRQGCHDIVIENITGFTEDDSIALTGVHGTIERAFCVEGIAPDICNVIIRHIHTAAFCTNVRLLNQSMVPLHHILVEDVRDMAEFCDSMDTGLYAVRIGDKNFFGDHPNTEKETYAITIKNVVGKGRYALGFAGGMKDITVENVEFYGERTMFEDLRNER